MRRYRVADVHNAVPVQVAIECRFQINFGCGHSRGTKIEIFIAMATKKFQKVVQKISRKLRQFSEAYENTNSIFLLRMKFSSR